jgi:5-carboxymethyl-2-hydroxymuconate isomerase
MPHIIIEHSSDFSSDSIITLQTDIQSIMASITEGNFDPDQCKARAISFNEYLVGKPNQETALFLHITIKILAGRTLVARQKLSEKVMTHAKEFFNEILFSPSEIDQAKAIGIQVADLVSGMPTPPSPLQNSNFAGKRCDISVDIVEMDKEAYQKFRI